MCSHSCRTSGCSCTGRMTAAGGLPKSAMSTPSATVPCCSTKQVCQCLHAVLADIVLSAARGAHLRVLSSLAVTWLSKYQTESACISCGFSFESSSAVSPGCCVAASAWHCCNYSLLLHAACSKRLTLKSNSQRQPRVFATLSCNEVGAPKPHNAVGTWASCCRGLAVAKA